MVGDIFDHGTVDARGVDVKRLRYCPRIVADAREGSRGRANIHVVYAREGVVDALHEVKVVCDHSANPRAIGKTPTQLHVGLYRLAGVCINAIAVHIRVRFIVNRTPGDGEALAAHALVRAGALDDDDALSRIHVVLVSQDTIVVFQHKQSSAVCYRNVVLVNVRRAQRARLEGIAPRNLHLDALAGDVAPPPLSLPYGEVQVPAERPLVVARARDSRSRPAGVDVVRVGNREVPVSHERHGAALRADECRLDVWLSGGAVVGVAALRHDEPQDDLARLPRTCRDPTGRRHAHGLVGVGLAEAVLLVPALRAEVVGAVAEDVHGLVGGEAWVGCELQCHDARDVGRGHGRAAKCIVPCIADAFGYGAQYVLARRRDVLALAGVCPSLSRDVVVRPLGTAHLVRPGGVIARIGRDALEGNDSHHARGVPRVIIEGRGGILDLKAIVVRVRNLVSRRGHRHDALLVRLPHLRQEHVVLERVASPDAAETHVHDLDVVRLGALDDVVVRQGKEEGVGMSRIVKTVNGHDPRVVRDAGHPRAVVRRGGDDPGDVGPVVLVRRGTHVIEPPLVRGIRVIGAPSYNVLREVLVVERETAVDHRHGDLPLAPRERPRLVGPHALEAPELVCLRVVDGDAVRGRPVASGGVA